MITIGSDPEFGLVDQNGKQVKAYNHLSDSTRERVGVDGHSDIGEIRPAFGHTPREHLANIAALMAQVDEKIPADIKITAGSMVGEDPIGGHIHFGALGRNFNFDAAAKALDYYVSLPVSLIEVQRSARIRRTGSGYGHLSAVRSQPWGFEYRTLPSWLLGWGVALSVLSIGYAVVDAVKGKSCPDVPRRTPDPSAFNNCRKEEMRSLLNQIRVGWRELPLYSDLRLEIAFLNHLLVRKMEWKEGQDIRHKWHPVKRLKGQHQVLGNYRDLNCPAIAALVKGIKGTKVFLYGINPKRSADIAISDPAMSGVEIDYKIEDTMYGVSREYNGWLCIGLSLELRRDVHAAAMLVNRILSQH